MFQKQSTRWIQVDAPSLQVRMIQFWDQQGKTQAIPQAISHILQCTCYQYDCIYSLNI